MFCADCIRIVSPESGLFPGPEGSSDALKTNMYLDGTFRRARIPTSTIQFKASLADLKESARQCSCCSGFYEQVKVVWRMDRKPLFVTRLFKAFDTKPDETVAAGDSIILERSETSVNFDIFTSDITNEWDCGITRRKIVQQAERSLEQFQYVRDLLQNCEKSHNECSTLNDAFSPTRLLDVAPPNKHGVIQLISGTELFRPIKYIAFSHCWGPPEKKPISTNIHNEKDHRENGILMEKLPRSFSDAVMFAHALNIRYIWIDSLCIIQDSEEDWANESHQMGDIYKSATLTLAASLAIDSSRGFLGSETLSDGDYYNSTSRIQRPYFKLYSPSFHAGRTLWLRRDVNVENDFQSFVIKHSRQALAFRAWALQERLLSRRTIFFDSSMLQWECKTVRHLEQWAVNVRNFFPSLQFDFSRSAYPQWYTVVEEFRSRILTYDTDALPAMSGLAREFAQATNDTYLAGLWRNDIFRGLSWGFPRISRGYRPGLEYAPLAQAECFAPTWSWASLNSGVKILHSPSFFGRSALWENAACFLPGSPPQKLLSSEIISRSSDPTGQITSAKLVIQGSCRKVAVNLHKNDLNNHGHPYGHWPKTLVIELEGLLPKYLNQFAYHVFDHSDHFEEQARDALSQGEQFNLVCFLLGRSEETDLHCLLLQEDEVSGNTQLYRRCGVMRIKADRGSAFYEGWSQTTITIV